jgi:hypothetical protein
LLPSSHCSRSGLPAVAAGREDAQVADVQRRGQRREQVRLGRDDEPTRVVTRAQRPGAHVPEHAGVGDDRVGAHHRHHGVEVHEGPARRQRDREHGRRRPGREQTAGDRLDGLGRGPLAHPHQHGTPADHVDVAALDGGRAVVMVDTAEPALDPGVGEQRVEPVDRLEVRSLPAPRRHRHGVE